jgi:hypothetical protein
MSDNETVLLELPLSAEQYERLAAFARSWQLPVGQAAQVAIAEWLAGQSRLAQARDLMRELAQGLGEAPAPYDVARHHDEHLYSPDD